ncbi:MAG: PDZ domain-containing protein [Pseudomonadota bacterium]|jgi:type II secretory pathway component PulC
MIRFAVGFILSMVFTCAHAMTSWYGVQVQPMNTDMLESQGVKAKTGVIVVKVDPSSPAKQALQKGDIFLSVNDNSITLPCHLLANQLSPGQHVHLKILRKGEHLTTTFTMPHIQSGKTAIDDQILGSIEIEQRADGMMVVAIHRQGLLQLEDRIIEINNHKIQRVEDVSQALAANDKSLSIVIDRNGARIVQSFAVDGNGSFFSSQTIISTN